MQNIEQEVKNLIVDINSVFKNYVEHKEYGNGLLAFLKTIDDIDIKNIEGIDVVAVKGLELLYAVALLQKAGSDPDNVNDFETISKQVFEPGEKVKVRVASAWKELEPLRLKYDSTVYVALAKDNSIYNDEMDEYNEEIITQPVSDLAKKLLNPQVGENVSHLFCDKGELLLDLFGEQPNAKYGGVTSKGSKNIFDARVSILTGNEKMVNDRFVFQYMELKEDIPNLIESPSYDKIFVTYPLIIANKHCKLEDKIYDTDLQELKNRYPFITRTTSATWYYNLKLINFLKEDGQLVALMTHSALWNKSDAPIRKYFIQNNLIKAVISLPNNIMGTVYGSTVKFALVIFSRNNEGVRVVDADQDKLYYNCGDLPCFTEANLTDIISALDNDTEYSKMVPKEICWADDGILNPSRYLETKVTNGRELGLIADIIRAANLSEEQMDEYYDEKDSNPDYKYHYVKISDVKNGIIQDGLHGVKELDSSQFKAVLRDGDIIITKLKIENRYKLAIADTSRLGDVFPVGSQYIIRCNKEAVNPYYLLAYLKSEKGLSEFERLENVQDEAKGKKSNSKTNKFIRVDSLKRILVELPEMMLQERIGSRYKEKLEEIARLQSKLNAAINDLGHILTDGDETTFDKSTYDLDYQFEKEMAGE